MITSEEEFISENVFKVTLDDIKEEFHILKLSNSSGEAIQQLEEILSKLDNLRLRTSQDYDEQKLIEIESFKNNVQDLINRLKKKYEENSVDSDYLKRKFNELEGQFWSLNTGKEKRLLQADLENLKTGLMELKKEAERTNQIPIFQVAQTNLNLIVRINDLKARIEDFIIRTPRTQIQLYKPMAHEEEQNDISEYSLLESFNKDLENANYFPEIQSALDGLEVKVSKRFNKGLQYGVAIDQVLQDKITFQEKLEQIIEHRRDGYSKFPQEILDEIHNPKVRDTLIKVYLFPEKSYVQELHSSLNDLAENEHLNIDLVLNSLRNFIKEHKTADSFDVFILSRKAVSEANAMIDFLEKKNKQIVALDIEELEHIYANVLTLESVFSGSYRVLYDAIKITLANTITTLEKQAA